MTRPQNSPTSGGIYLTTEKRRASVVPVVKAWIRVAPGKQAFTKYSIAKHGVAGARRLATKWLKMKQKEQRENYRVT